MENFRSLISLWNTRVEMASDMGVGKNVVQQWYNRDSIPADRWIQLIAAAESRGFEGITLELLASIAASNRTKSEAAA